MAAETEPSRLERIVAVLQRHGVEFVVIGGQAATLHGSALLTQDVDLCYRRTEENLERLAAALRELDPKLRGVPPDLPFTLDARSLALGSNFTLSTREGDLDLLGYVEPLGGYDDIAARAERYELDAGGVLVISLDDLIRVKEHIGRPHDRAALPLLLALRREREGGRGG